MRISNETSSRITWTRVDLYDSFPKLFIHAKDLVLARSSTLGLVDSRMIPFDSFPKSPSYQTILLPGMIPV